MGGSSVQQFIECCLVGHRIYFWESLAKCHINIGQEHVESDVELASGTQ